MRDEPVRGTVPERSFFSLSGREQVEAWLRRRIPRSPLARLLGMRLTQVGSGSATLSLPVSPWFQQHDGTVDVTDLAEVTIKLAVLTGVPPGHSVHTAALSVSYLRPATMDSEVLTARGRVVHSGRSFTLTEALIEDALGRLVAHATGSVLVRAMEPPPEGPCLLEGVDEPTYPTPDPYLRPLPPDVTTWPETAFELPGVTCLRMTQSGELPISPKQALLGWRLVDVAEGNVLLSLTTSGWHCAPSHDVNEGVLGAFIHPGLAAAVYSLSPGGRRVGIIDQTINFFRPVPADGREVLLRATVVRQIDEFFVCSAEAIDAEGNIVALGHETAVLTERRSRGASPESQSERVLATVLFTDIVGSTELAAKMGDAGWSALLADHHDVVRRHIKAFKGREVKTTGDGFLATFETPARAVHCARAIRDGVRGLGLEVRAGLHTGECELLSGDLAGIAVHAAARIVHAAKPGEILVSGTVRDIAAGSGLRFVERGRQPLKGLEGEWQLFGAEG